MDNILKAMTLVSKILNKEKLPEEYEGREEEILYVYETAKLGYRQKNPYYPILRKSLERTFDREIREGFLAYMRPLEYTSNLKILDVGCGNGQYLTALPTTFLKYGIDNKDVENTSKFTFRKGRFPDDILVEKFDVIMMAEFLHLFGLPDRDKMIKAALEMLVPGGKLVIIENRSNPDLAYRLNKLGSGRLVSPTICKNVMWLENHWIGVIDGRL